MKATKKFLVAAFCFVVISLSVGCGVVNTITSLAGSDPGMKTASELWSDVPRMDGLTTSQMEMPLFGKVLVRTALNATGEGKDTGDWIVFSTNKTPDDVKNFYTNERMEASGWEPSKNSTCLNGSEQGVPGVGVFCVFEKKTAGKQIGLMILCAQDDKTKETSVFYVRVEQLVTPVANNPSAQNGGAESSNKQSKNGGITMLNGPAPYGIEKRPMPGGLDLDQLLPRQVGPYTRASVEESAHQGTQATTVKKDGDSIYAHYRSGGTEIFVEFAVSSSASDAQAALDVAASETTGEFPGDPRFGSMGTEPSYLKVNNEYGAFFAWTRGGYYYSASAKSGEADLDAFMQAFPY